MNKQEIASLAVKIIAIYIIVNALVTGSLSLLPYLQQFYATAQAFGINESIYSFQDFLIRELFTFLFPAIIAFILWKISDRLGKKMVHGSDSQKPKQSLNALELHTILLSVVGVFVTINAIPGLVGFLVALSVPSLPGADFRVIFLQLLNPILSLLMGWFLIFYASRISQALFKERS